MPKCFQTLGLAQLVTSNFRVSWLLLLAVTALLMACNGGGLSGSAVGQPDGQVIPRGEVKQGAIAQAGSYEEWTFEGVRGQGVSIYLESANPDGQSSLDPVVILRSPSGRIEAHNDDWIAGNSASSISIRLAESGRYAIVARGYADSTGQYSLHFCGGTAGVCEEDIAAAETIDTISAENAEQGDIGRAGQFDNWTFEGARGQRVSIILAGGWVERVDTVLADTVLDLIAPSGVTVATNDDSSEGHGIAERDGQSQAAAPRPQTGQSEISHTLEETGTYTIVARGFGGYYSGAYTVALSLENRPLVVTRPLAGALSESVDYVPLPSVDQEMVPWDPEIGIRIQPRDGHHDLDLGRDLTITGLADAISLSLCNDDACSNAEPVPGETKLLPQDGDFSREVVLGNPVFTPHEDWVRTMSPTGDMEVMPSHRVISFIPEVPLYGASRYKVEVSADARVVVGSSEATLPELTGRAEWQFTTAEMTRFMLPVNLKYNNTACFGQTNYLTHSYNDGPGMCQDISQLSELVFGTEPGKLNHYFHEQSGGQFVLSPVRDRQGNVRKTVQLDRQKDWPPDNLTCFHRGEVTGTHWGADHGCPFPAELFQPGIASVVFGMFDFERYANITHRDTGSINVLPPYKPDRSQAAGASTGDDGYMKHRNVYIAWNFGVPLPITFGSSSKPQTQNDLDGTWAHGVGGRTWVHEFGHGLFGIEDFYLHPHDYKGAETKHTGDFDVMGDNDGTWTPFSAFSRVSAEFLNPTSLISDDAASHFLFQRGDLALSACGNDSVPCVIHPNDSAEYNIIQVPAIIERDTGSVLGHYWIEYYGSGGYNQQIPLDSNTLAFSDQQGPWGFSLPGLSGDLTDGDRVYGDFPGGIVVWKIDRTDQKSKHMVCFPGITHVGCDTNYLVEAGYANRYIQPELYPSIPSAVDTKSYHLFPWWYSAGLPLDANFEQDLSSLPNAIELPILEIGPWPEIQDFGGGNKIGVVTLRFDSLINNLKDRIRRADSSDELSLANTYKLDGPLEFTYEISRLETPVAMTYKDHIRERQLSLVTPESFGDPEKARRIVFDEVMERGYFRSRRHVATLAETSPVPAFNSTDYTTNFVFSSTKPGTAIFSGGCSSPDMTVVDGNNAVTLDPMPDGTYSDCTLQVVTDGGYESWPLRLTEFVIENDYRGPRTSPDAVATSNGRSVVVDVLVNDTDADGDTLTIESVAQGSNGTVVIAAGRVTYTHDGSPTTSDTFTYSAGDGSGITATGTVTVTVTPPVNNAPVAIIDATMPVADGGTVEILVLANDTDADGDTLTIESVTQGTNGTVEVSTYAGVHTVIYTHDGSATVDDTFTYTVNDGNGGTAIGTVAVVIVVPQARTNLPVNAADDADHVGNGGSVEIDVLANDTDADGHTLTIDSVTGGLNGTVAITQRGVTYTHDGSATTYGDFTYTVSDGHGSTDTGSVSVTIANSSPVAVDDAGHVANKGGSIEINVLANDTDADGDTLTIDSFIEPGIGTVEITANGMTFTHDGSDNLVGSIGYTVSDGHGGTDTGSVEVTISPEVNNDPIAVDDTFIVRRGWRANYSGRDNDTDPDGDSLTIVGVSQPSYGRSGIPTSGNFGYVGEGSNRRSGTGLSYTHAGDDNTSDTFTYTLSDGNGGTATATVNVTVVAANIPPTVVNDTGQVETGGRVEIDILANDSDAEIDSLSVRSVTQGANGTVEPADGGWYLPATWNSGKLAYTHDGSPTTSDTFTYTLDDGYGGTVTGTVTITIAATVNNAPVAVDDAIIHYGDAVDGGTVEILVLANDTDADGNALTVDSVTPGTNGTVEVTAGGVSYTHDGSDTTSDTFTYTVSDGNGGTDTASVAITIAPPVAAFPDEEPLVVVIASGGSVEIDVLASDKDAGDDTLTLDYVTQGSNGTVDITRGGVTYTHDGPATSSDSFTYTVSGINAGTAIRNVTVTIEAGNTPPVSVDDVVRVPHGGIGAYDEILYNDTDADGDALTITGVTQGTHGVVDNLDWGVRYTHDGSATTSDSFTYTVSDGNGGTATGTVTVAIAAAANNAPVAVDDASGVANGGTIEIDVVDKDSDADGDTLTIDSVSQGTNGTVEITAGGVTYTHDGSTTTSDTFTYTVSDGNGGTATGTVTVAIATAENNAPVAVDDASSVANGGTIEIDVVNKDSDSDGDTLTIESVTQGTSGTVEITAGGVTYTHDGSPSTSDTFTYTVSDGNGGWDTGTVTLTIVE